MIIVPLTLKQANDFVREHHRHSRPVVGHRFSIGVAHDGELVGVAIVGRPVARNLDGPTTAEVTRTCVLPDAPKGANSKLYSAAWRAWRAMGGERLVTYTLKGKESGASLRGAGWNVVAETKPQANPWCGPGRHREHQDIFDAVKYRWEVREQKGGTE